MINKKKEELSFLEGMQPIALLCEEEVTTNYVFGYARICNYQMVSSRKQR